MKAKVSRCCGGAKVCLRLKVEGERLLAKSSRLKGSRLLAIIRFWHLEKGGKACGLGFW